METPEPAEDRCAEPTPARLGIVFFDGACNFCNAAIDLLIRHDPQRALRYSSLQSAFAQRFFRRYGIELDLDHLDRLFYFDGSALHSRSSAALRLTRELGGAWRLLTLLRVVPAPLRDRLYDLMARNRYRAFGRREGCRVPTAAERELFLED